MRRTIGTSGRGNMRHGLISLLTVVVVISLATAAVLAVSTSHAMAALAQRQARMTQEGYAAERSGQALLAALDDELAAAREDGTSGRALDQRVENRINSLLVEACADGVTATYGFENGVLTCTFVTENGRMLQASVVLGDDATFDVVGWQLTAAPQEEDTGDVLWSGSAAGE